MSAYWTEAAHNAAYHGLSSPIVFLQVVKVKAARIEHHCTLCGKGIMPGDSYTRSVGMLDTDTAPYVLKEHIYC